MATKTLDFLVRLKDQATKQIKGMRGQLQGLKGVMSNPVFGSFATFFGAGAAVGVMGSMLKTMGDFEQSMNKVGAISKANAQEMKALEESARQLGASTRFSASEVSEGMSFMAMAGFEVNEIVGAMPNVLNLATAAQVDMATAADISSNILTGFGLETHELAMANDTLVAAMTNSNVDLRMLGESMKYVGPVASGLGVDFKQTAAAIALMGNAGIQGSMSGTALRGALTRLASPTDKETKLMEKLNLTQIKNAEGGIDLVKIIHGLEKTMKDGASQTEVAALALELFGDRAGPGMMALVSQGSDELLKMLGILDKSAGVTDETAARMNKGLNAQLRALKSAWEETALVIGDTGVLNTATSGLIEVTAALRGVTEIVKDEGFWAGIGQAIAGTVVEWSRMLVELLFAIPETVFDIMDSIFGFDISAVARGQLETVKAVIMGFFDWLTAMISGDTGTWDAFFGAFAAGWEWARTAAIIAFSFIQAKAVWLYDTLTGGQNTTTEAIGRAWQSVKDFFVSMWTGAVDFFVGLWEGVVGFFTGVWSAIVGTVREVGMSIVGLWGSMVGAIQGAMSAFINWLFVTFPQIPEIISLVVQIIGALWQRLLDGMEVVANGIMDIWDAIAEGVQSIVETLVMYIVSAWEAIVSTAQSVLSVLIGVFSGIWSAIVVTVQPIVDTIAAIWSALVGVLSGVFNSILDAASSLWSSMTSVIQGAMDAITGIATAGWEAMKGSTTSVLSGIRETVSGAFNAIRGIVQSLSNAMKTVFINALNTMKRAADRILDAILAKVKWVADKVGLNSIWPDLMARLVDVTGWWAKQSDKMTTEWSKNTVATYQRTADEVVKTWTNAATGLSTASMFGSQLPQLAIEQQTKKGTILKVDPGASKIWKLFQDLAVSTVDAHEAATIKQNDAYSRQILDLKVYAQQRKATTEDLNKWTEAATTLHNQKMNELAVRETERQRQLWMTANEGLLTQFDTDMVQEQERYTQQLTAFSEYAALRMLSEDEMRLYREQAEALHQENMWLIHQSERDRQADLVNSTIQMWSQILGTTTEQTQMLGQMYMDFGTGVTDIFADTVSDIWLGMTEGGRKIERAAVGLLAGLASAMGDYFVKEGLTMVAAGVARSLLLGTDNGLIAAGAGEIAAGSVLKALGAAGAKASSGGGGGAGGGGGGGIGGGFNANIGGQFGFDSDVGVAGRDENEVREDREGRVIIDLVGLGERQIVTDVPGFVEEIITEINRAAKRDIEIQFTGD